MPSVDASTRDLPGVVWMLAASPRDLDTLALDREYKRLLERLRERGADKLRLLPNTRAEEIVELLQDAPDTRILHFSGHGSAAGLELEDQAGLARAVSAEVLAQVFAALGHRLSCVVLNACDSVDHARQIGAHVRWTVGMAGAIGDETARGFAASFYVALAEGRTVDAAFAEARAWVAARSPDQGAVPRLFERGRLHPGSSPSDEIAEPTDRTADDLGDELEALEAQIRERMLAGHDSAVLSERLLDLRRRQRRGPGLRRGQLLAERYELGVVAGVGGFATVWKAYDRHSRALVAVKVLHAQHAQDQSRRARFEAGTRRARTLNHPGIVKVLDGPLDDEGYYFYVLPWYPGGDLRRAREQGGLDIHGALSVLGPVLEGVVYAHAQGVVHRDLKPGNVLLDEQGHGGLADFDLARARDSTQGTRTGALGTFVYAAPEQLEDASRVDARADVYAAGMTVLFALLGRDPPALVAKTAPELLEMVHCGAGLREALREALAYDPQVRASSCLDLAAAVRAELSGVVDERCPAPQLRDDLIKGPIGDVVVKAPPGGGGGGSSLFSLWVVLALAGLLAAGFFLASC